jgi:diguanylate cyclase (GGDEF)-like protein
VTGLQVTLAVAAVSTGGGWLVGWVAGRAERRQLRAAAAVGRVDPLTGLLDRSGLAGAVEAAAAAAVRTGGVLAVAVADLDWFKPVNDTLGHAAGDRVLVEMAGRLSSVACWYGGAALRWGGDEFVLVAGVPSAAAEQLPAAVRGAVGDTPVRVSGRWVQLGVSVGVAVVDPADGPVATDRLLQTADTAMYVDKRAHHAGTGQPARAGLAVAAVVPAPRTDQPGGQAAGRDRGAHRA